MFRYFHGGFWHSCGSNGCRYVKPTVARPFQNASQAFYLLSIIIATAGCVVLLMAVMRAYKRRHAELSKAAGLTFLFAGLCGVIAMSSYVGKTNDTVSALPCYMQRQAAQSLTHPCVNTVAWR